MEAIKELKMTRTDTADRRYHARRRAVFSQVPDAYCSASLTRNSSKFYVKRSFKRLLGEGGFPRPEPNYQFVSKNRRFPFAWLEILAAPARAIA
jgi:hypothetical protein